MYSYLRLIPCLCLLLFLAACGDSVTEPDIEEIDFEQEGLDTPPAPNQVASMKAIPQTTFQLGDIILPNTWTVEDYLNEYGLLDETDGGASTGPMSIASIPSASANGSPGELGPQAQKNLLIALMTQKAYFLTTDANHQYDEASSSAPAQNGLAYVWGSKAWNTRNTPTSPGACEDTALHGLDASGFMYRVVNHGAGLQLPDRTVNTQRQAGTWNDAFARAGLDKISTEDVGELDTDDFESGDIIYWTNNEGVATHIGLVIENGQRELALFHSPGYANDNCEENADPGLGPTQTSLDDPYWFGGDAGSWSVLRVVTDITGQWELYGRCASQDEDAFMLEIELTADDEQEVFAETTGTDYDGSHMEIELSGTYQQVSNLLAAEVEFYFPDSDVTRIDQFEQRLNEDDTGYFEAELIYHDRSGCTLAIRIVNTETSELPGANITAPTDATGSGRLSQ